MRVLIKLVETIRPEVFFIHCKVRTAIVIKIWQKKDIFLFQDSELGCKKYWILPVLTLSLSLMPSTQKRSVLVLAFPIF